MTRLAEDHIEQWMLELLMEKGFIYLSPDKLDPDVNGSMREGYGELVIGPLLLEALQIINPNLSAQALQQAVREVGRVNGAGDLVACNARFQELLTQGVDVSFLDKGEERTVKVWLADFHQPDNNTWIVTHQMTIVENGQNKRPDILILLNGIPVVVIELKNAADANATIDKAWQQLRTYHRTIPSLFGYNLLEIISDGLEARVGTITADMSRFMSWKTADVSSVASGLTNQLETMVRGLLDKETLLSFFRHFTVFEQFKRDDAQTGTITIGTVKKIAAYHQFYAVLKAVEATRHAVDDGSGKAGVIWHTEIGKSLSMVFYAGLLVQELDNPTILVITDRNDLDDQLFETFANCKQLLRQTPVQIDSRSSLVTELKGRKSGGIFFTTIQKFLPEEGAKAYEQLSDRRNIIVIADEAHRTQYGFDAKIRTIKDAEGNEVGMDFSYGFARHMHDALPNATFIGFTGTPVESSDKNTKAVFGEYIDIYDIERAVVDGATVPIYYENRFAKLKFKEEYYKIIDEKLENIVDGLPEYMVQGAVEKATRQESIVGNPDRLKAVAADIVNHFEDRAQVLAGKALVVAMSRNIAVKLYNEIVSLRPDWHDEDDRNGKIKVIMTGSSSDEEFLQPHIRNKLGRTGIANRLKDKKDPLQMVIVVDMWLTGFDAPVLHTLYLDKDMSGHNLMQAIARVNRVFRDKPGGLIVDYVPVTGNLKAALKTYTDSDGKGQIAIDVREAVDIMLTKFEVVQQMFHGFDYHEYFKAPINRKLNIILESEEHILALEDGKERYLREVTALSKAYALAKSEPEARLITEEVAFFQAVKARLVKFDPEDIRQRKREFEETVKSLAESAIASDGIINLLDQVGLQRPEVSIFSEGFMEEVRNMKQKHVALEILKKLLNDQIKLHFKRNAVVQKTLSERLQSAINQYNQKSITALEMLELLLEISKEVNTAMARGKDLGLSETELAFYDALSINKSAREMMGDEKLMVIARELVSMVKNNTTIDWTIRQSAKDKVKLAVKRVLRKYQYPPDDEPRATEVVLEQAELHAAELV